MASALGVGLALACILTSGGVHAQEGTALYPSSLDHRGLWVGMGILRLHQADDLASPLRYGGISWSASLGLDLSSPNSLRNVRLSYAEADLTSSASQDKRHRQSGYWADVRALYLHRVAGFRDGDLEVHLGGALSLRYTFYEHWYTDQETETWIHGFSLLEPGGGWHFRLPNGDILWQEVTLPLGGIVLRSPYQGLTELPSPVWEWFGGVEGIHQAIHYQRTFNDRWEGGVSYSFEGFRYSEPRPLAWTRHTLTFFLSVWSPNP